MRKAEKMHFSVAFVLFDIAVTSVLMWSRDQGLLVTLSKDHSSVNILNDFFSEATWPISI